MKIKSLLKNVVMEFLYYIALIVSKVRGPYERAAGLVQLRSISNKGDGCSFEGGGIIIDPHNLCLGDHIYIGRNSFIRATGGIKIGSYTHISRNVTIHTVNHNAMGELLPYDRNDIKKAIEIGQYVWVGMNVSILPGVKIGDGAIIGMGATISKNIEPNEIVVGGPQRVVGKRNEEHVARLLQAGRFLRG